MHREQREREREREFVYREICKNISRFMKIISRLKRLNENILIISRFMKIISPRSALFVLKLAINKYRYIRVSNT